MIRENIYDCVIVDYMLPDIGGLDFVMEINAAKKIQMMPIIVYSAKDFSSKEKTQLRQYANRVLLKKVNSLEAAAGRDNYAPASESQGPAAGEKEDN